MEQEGSVYSPYHGSCLSGTCSKKPQTSDLRQFPVTTCSSYFKMIFFLLVGEFGTGNSVIFSWTRFSVCNAVLN